MKKKFMPLAFTLVLGSVCFAQQVSQVEPTKKVGINTDKPVQTLDVKGTVRVTTLGNPEGDDIHRVGWDETTHQVVDMGLYTAMKFFQRKHVEIPVNTVNASNHGTIGVESYDLGVDAKKYSIIVTEPRLVYAANYGSNPNKVAYIKIVSVGDKDQYVKAPGVRGRVGITYGNGPRNAITNVTVASLDHNSLATQDGVHVLQGTLVKTDGTASSVLDRNPLLYEAPKVVVFKEGEKWKFTGKYYYSSPANDANGRYKWVFDMLIVDNSWIQYGKNVIMTVKNDGAGNPTIAEVVSTRQAY